MIKKGLGRGLEALLDGGKPEDKPDSSTGGVIQIDIRKIEPNRQQPRQHFDDDALQELAESIKAYGIIQPLIVKDCGEYYSIIAGERRFRAARLAKLASVPALVKDYTELEILQIALIENIQRQDLTPIEEAACYKRLIDDFFFTQEDIAAKIGKNRNAISTAVRLLDLDLGVQAMVNEGALTASHARVLLAVRDGERQLAYAEQVVAEALSVRETEKLIAEAKKEPAERVPQTKTPMADAAYQATRMAYRHVEDELKTLLGAKVNIHYGKRKGKIEIEYVSPDELDRIVSLFKRVHVGADGGI